MKKVTLLSICIMCYLPSNTKVKAKNCGPIAYFYTRSFLQNDSLNHKPFDAIVHVNMNGWGTATFINDSTLITAKHIAQKEKLNQITIYKNIFKNGKVENEVAILSKNDFTVINTPYDSCHFISSDISFVILKPSGKNKIAHLYTGHIQVADYSTLNINKNTKIVLTGYSVDLAGRGANNTDILSNKTTTFGELQFDANCKMVGYKLYTCKGDSGAPLWIEINGQFYVIGIHHGGTENGTIFNTEKRNSAALIRNEILPYR